jgi:hypothetical protein
MTHHNQTNELTTWFLSIGTHLIRSSAYHPQIDCQTERVNQIVEDMLHACVLNDGLKWDRHLPLAEFFYNNSYQESLKMSLFRHFIGVPVVHH